MQMLQTYDTTLLSDTSEHTFRAIVVPNRSMPVKDDHSWVQILEALEIRKLKEVSPATMAMDMATLLSPEIPEMEILQRLTETTPALNAPALRPDDVNFAALVCFDSVVPFENSPLSLDSLGKFVTKASGPAIGAYVGFVVFGATPLLLVGVPAGMIICGAARGVATALEKGLEQKLLAWLKPKKQSATMPTIRYKEKPVKREPETA